MEIWNNDFKETLLNNRTDLTSKSSSNASAVPPLHSLEHQVEKASSEKPSQAKFFSKFIIISFFGCGKKAETPPPTFKHLTNVTNKNKKVIDEYIDLRFFEKFPDPKEATKQAAVYKKIENETNQEIKENIESIKKSYGWRKYGFIFTKSFEKHILNTRIIPDLKSQIKTYKERIGEILPYIKNDKERELADLLEIEEILPYEKPQNQELNKNKNVARESLEEIEDLPYEDYQDQEIQNKTEQDKTSLQPLQLLKYDRLIKNLTLKTSFQPLRVLKYDPDKKPCLNNNSTEI
jgi:hypothetical protein